MPKPSARPCAGPLPSRPCRLRRSPSASLDRGERGAPAEPGRDEETALRSNKETEENKLTLTLPGRTEELMFARARRVDGTYRTSVDPTGETDLQCLLGPRSRQTDQASVRGFHQGLRPLRAPIGRTHDRKQLLLLITPKVLAGQGPSAHEAPP